ncbi:MAG: V-type ATP synthase subunit I [Clostridiales bacterium]|nr:V-type ATP synthase subunit I [Clostridiales bacterium]
MAKQKMKRVSLYAPRSDRRRLLSLLQRMGILELQEPDEDTGLFQEDKDAQAQTYERATATLEQALEILRQVVPASGGMLASLSGRREISYGEFDGYEQRRNTLIRDCHDIVALQKQRGECRTEIARIDTVLSQLEPWVKLDVPLSFRGTKSTAAFIGSLPALYTGESLNAALAEGEEALPFETEILSAGREQTCVFLLCRKRDAQRMENKLRVLGFARPPHNTAELPKDKGRELRIRRDALREDQDILLSLLTRYGEKREELETMADYCRSRAERYRIISQLRHTRHTVLITGYLPETALPLLESSLREYPVLMETEDADPESAPVLLKNSAFARPVESITEMYALPAAGDIDPTSLTSVFFYCFFGMMLSDAGYGLLLVLGTWLMIRKLHPEPRMRRNLKLFQYCGVATIIWGLLFGSFFGDIVTVVAANFFGRPDFQLPRLFDPVQEPVLLLVISLALGFIQIMAGLGAKLYTQWHGGDRWGAIFDSGFWMTALLGVALLAAGGFIAPVLSTVGIVLAVVSLAGLVLTQGRSKKGPMKLLSGIASLYDVTGYASDLMSYSRLMALGLTTGVMATVFNKLGGMAGGGVGGAVVLLLAFVIGHSINFALNALGAYVHTIRLQYVELFSKFYEGGGRPFAPFGMKGHYVRLKEDDNNV